MFTRCRSLSAAEEIKVKQKKRERGKAGLRGEGGGDKESEGGEEGEMERDVNPAGYMW